MDVDLAVPARRTGDDLALEIDGQDVDHGDLVEAHAVRLHEKQFWLAGHPHRDVAASEIVVALGDQNLAGHDQLLLDVPVRLVRFICAFRHNPCPQFACGAATSAGLHDAACRATLQDNDAGAGSAICACSASDGGTAISLPAMTMAP